MNKNYFYPLIFLILLALTVFSHMRTAFAVVPGWHTTIYPPKYIITLSLIILFLLLSIIGYGLLSWRHRPISVVVFILHLALTIPLIIVFVFPFKFIDRSSPSLDEFERLYNQRQCVEYLALSIFSLGQLFFLIYLIKQFRSKFVNK